MVELLRHLLTIRETLRAFDARAGDYQLDLPEIAQMQALERQIFEKVNKWDKPL